MFKTIAVLEHHNGVLFKDGKYVTTHEPGRYRYWRGRYRVLQVDMRRRVTIIPAQELLTSDGIGVKATVVVDWQVSDARLAVESVMSYDQSIYVAGQLALRDVLVSKTFEEVMANRATFSDELLAAFQPAMAEIGVTAHRIEFKDLMLPGELKRIYTQVAEAKQQGLAELERARSQTATLRTLANVAKMLKDNPELVQARVLDAMENTKGNTFVIGTDALETAKRS